MLAKTSNAVDTEARRSQVNNHERADVDHQRHHSGLAHAAACRCVRTQDAHRAVSTYGMARGGRHTRVRAERHRTDGRRLHLDWDRFWTGEIRRRSFSTLDAWI